MRSSSPAPRGRQHTAGARWVYLLPPSSRAPGCVMRRHAPTATRTPSRPVRLRTRGRRRRRRLGRRLGRGDGGSLRSRLATQQATEHARHSAMGEGGGGIKGCAGGQIGFGRTQIGFGRTQIGFDKTGRTQIRSEKCQIRSDNFSPASTPTARRTSTTRAMTLGKPWLMLLPLDTLTPRAAAHSSATPTGRCGSMPPSRCGTHDLHARGQGGERRQGDAMDRPGLA